jgi:hypothetical protein
MGKPEAFRAGGQKLKEGFGEKWGKVIRGINSHFKSGHRVLIWYLNEI